MLFVKIDSDAELVTRDLMRVLLSQQLGCSDSIGPLADFGRCNIRFVEISNRFSRISRVLKTLHRVKSLNLGEKILL